TEFAIDMEVSLMAGITTFIVSNDGSMEHNFALIGEAIDTRFDENLAPGETLTITTTLEPGTYDIFCPVADHESQGMQLSIQVIGPEVP
ncbi:MAG: cupredoxin domain-containing protein, partial [Chloroflexota bacterium]